MVINKYTFCAVLVVLECASAESTNIKSSSTNTWTWKCINTECVKTKTGSSEISQSLDVCRISCGQYGSLWPRPVGLIQIGKEITPFDPTNVQIGRISAPSTKVKDLINVAVEILRENLNLEITKSNRPQTRKSIGDVNEVNIKSPYSHYPALSLFFTVYESDTWVATETDESYHFDVILESDVIRIDIGSETYFGARHALETLSQLVAYDDRLKTLVVASNVSLWDRPSFVHRGIMLDTSRNYYSVDSIKRTLNAMSYNKLNVFHWHITDSQSFPFVSKRVPQMSLWGAYSPEKVYTPEDITDIVQYARVRGIKVIPEVDQPSHSGNGWQWGEGAGLGKLSLCINEEPYVRFCLEPPCGQLNPVNNNTLEILGDIYRDLNDVFHTDVYHMGGDEVNFECWRSSEEVSSWLQNRGLSTADDELLNLWSAHQEKSLKKLREATGSTNMSVIVWSSDLTKPATIQKYLDPKIYIIQYWDRGSSSELHDLVKQKYRVIVSNYDGWYLDCGVGDFTSPLGSWCNPYKTWKTVYSNNPLAMVSSWFDVVDTQLVLGGEAALWSETADETSVDSRLWPRGAAFAERLWSDPEEDWIQAQTRMAHHRERMVKRGIAADSIQPEWCNQNEEKCTNPIFKFLPFLNALFRY